MFREFLSLFALPEEDEKELSILEQGVRKTIDRTYRIGLASFFAYHTFEFLFNPIWMHGYVWSLNLPIDLDMADKSAGLIVAHQLKHVALPERVVHAIMISVSLMLMLWRCGFTRHVQRVSTLMSVGLITGIIVMFVRGLQMKQRLFSAIHEGCYTIIVTFTVGVCLTLRLPFDSVYRFPIETKKAKKIAEKEMMMEENKNAENEAYFDDKLKKSN